jgi:hypothetical protein
MRTSFRFSISLTIVMLVSPANACHHYARWYYPYPQPRCGIAARTTNPEDHSWSVEIIALPPAWERELAIDKLKEQLKEQLK